MKQSVPQQHHFHISFSSSVRARLTLWYLAMMAFIVCLFGVSLYVSQSLFNGDTAESKVETELYQDSQRFSAAYNQTLQIRQKPAACVLKLSSQELVLLLSPDGRVEDERGSLPDNVIQLLQVRAEQNVSMTDLSIPLSHPQHWWPGNSTSYRLLTVPVLNQNTRVATLLVGLPRPRSIPLPMIWFFHGLLTLLAASIGGYWLAGKVLRPMKLITRTANEINATDLRRRLHLQRKDEFGELAATFDHMLARLEAAFKRQTQFTADASHELRTPLTIINLEIERVLAQAEQSDEYRRVLQQIQSETEQMTAMVNSLLLLARADTGQMSLDLQEVDLSDVALTCVERLLPLAHQHSITLATGDLPELLVRGDSHYLGQMLTNLIENGIKYSSGIGKRVCVELTCDQNHRGVVRVQDDGPGISEEHLPLLFERFYRVDKARSHRHKGSTPDKTPDHEVPYGTGLGLSIVEWIVLAHGGQISVHSTIGQGSLFEVRLPLLSPVDDECFVHDKSMTK